MTMRTSSGTVTFSHPFTLSGIDGTQPAGTYTVETDEELLQTSSLPAYRRISTLLRLPARPGSMELGRIVDVDPAELAAILARDVRSEETPPTRAGLAAPAETAGPLRVIDKGWRRWAALNANELAWTMLIAGALLITSLFTER